MLERLAARPPCLKPGDNCSFNIGDRCQNAKRDYLPEELGPGSEQGQERGVAKCGLALEDWARGYIEAEEERRRRTS